MAFTLPGAGQSAAPLLRDVFNIPEHEGDTFVLKLADSVGRGQLADTVKNYVITDDIAENLSAALSYVEKALSSGDNQGIYLSGSFGSGKSHFMAVLYALLTGAPITREIPELQQLVADHSKAVQANLLQLPFHFLDSRSIEDTLFRGYLNYLRSSHPDASTPVLHSSGGLFEDADGLRESMGDDAFFAALNKATTGPNGAAQSGSLGDSGLDLSVFGVDTAATWTVADFQAARSGSAPQHARTALAQALTETLFKSYSLNSQWLSLADGLAVISDHAKSLGYDGVVLYLDELILWLTFLVPSREKFNQEAQKLTILVENQLGKLEVPLIFFIARQHDLATWKDTSIEAGADAEARQRALAHQSGRFNDIELGNRNLPLIANKRLLSPKDNAAQITLNDAFAKLNLRSEISNVLLDGVNTSEDHRASNMQSFQLTYPFSPALVDTLMNLAPAMQRERTGLKVMESLLVEKRDTMRIDSVIPIGDAFDHVINGSQHTQNALAEVFRKGKAFWTEKLKPLIYANANIDPGTPESDVPLYVQGHLRVGKTLILSALAPGVPALKAITASRLAHLNHGSMVELFSGDAVTSALAEVRKWAAQFPEILIQEGTNDPVITLKLEEVPWEDVIRGAQIEDTPPRRKARVRTELAKALQVNGLQQQNDGSYSRTVIWRGTPRAVEVIFGNVRDERELNSNAFQPEMPGALRLVVDLPIDETGHTIVEDHERIGKLQTQSGLAPFTIAWLPQFLTAEQQSRLGELIIIDHVLLPAGWRDHTSRLSEDVSEGVRQVLIQRQKTLESELRRQIATAYGAASGATFPEGQSPLRSLDPSVNITQQTGATLAEAADRLINQAFSSKFPDHPNFDTDNEITATDVNRVIEALRRAVSDTNGRTDLEPEARRAARILLPTLKLATVGESHIVFNIDTAASTINDIDAQLRAEHVDLNEEVPVRALQRAVASVNPRRGLSSLIIGLHIAAWAAIHNRSWYRDGQHLEKAPRVQELDPSMKLRPVELPSTEQWIAAQEVAGVLFGVVTGTHLNSTNLFQIRDQVSEKVAEHRNSVQAMSTELGTMLNRLGVNSRTQRSLLADELAGLLDRLSSSTSNAQRMVNHLADAVTAQKRILGASHQEAATALSTAGEVTTALRRLKSPTNLRNLETLRNYHASQPDSDHGASLILNRLVEGLNDHEFKTSVDSLVLRFEEEVAAWISDIALLPIVTPPVTPPPVDPTIPDPPIIDPLPRAQRTFTLKAGANFSEVEKELKVLGWSNNRSVRITVEFLDEEDSREGDHDR